LEKVKLQKTISSYTLSGAEGYSIKKTKYFWHPSAPGRVQKT